MRFVRQALNFTIRDVGTGSAKKKVWKNKKTEFGIRARVLKIPPILGWRSPFGAFFHAQDRKKRHLFFEWRCPLFVVLVLEWKEPAFLRLEPWGPFIKFIQIRNTSELMIRCQTLGWTLRMLTWPCTTLPLREAGQRGQGDKTSAQRQSRAWVHDGAPQRALGLISRKNQSLFSSLISASSTYSIYGTLSKRAN